MMAVSWVMFEEGLKTVQAICKVFICCETKKKSLNFEVYKYKIVKLFECPSSIISNYSLNLQETK